MRQRQDPQAYASMLHRMRPFGKQGAEAEAVYEHVKGRCAVCEAEMLCGVCPNGHTSKHPVIEAPIVPLPPFKEGQKVRALFNSKLVHEGDEGKVLWYVWDASRELYKYALDFGPCSGGPVPEKIVIALIRPGLDVPLEKVTGSRFKSYVERIAVKVETLPKPVGQMALFATS